MLLYTFILFSRKVHFEVRVVVCVCLHFIHALLIMLSAVYLFVCACGKTQIFRQKKSIKSSPCTNISSGSSKCSTINRKLCRYIFIRLYGYFCTYRKTENLRSILSHCDEKWKYSVSCVYTINEFGCLLFCYFTILSLCLLHLGFLQCFQLFFLGRKH